MASNVFVGTSGWSYPDDWVGTFYPAKIAPKLMLGFYAQVFYTNEINTTFYHNPRPAVVAGWARRTPANFDFSLKLPRQLTHTLKLAPDETPAVLAEFLEVCAPLGHAGKIATFLCQLPPSFARADQIEHLERFLETWDTLDPFGDASQMNLAIEFRNTSWLTDTLDALHPTVAALLKAHAAAYTIVAEPLLPPITPVTADHAYVRFHGFGKRPWFNYHFSPEELAEWKPKLEKISQQTRRVNVYFNNHFSGYAAKNALELLAIMGQRPRRDPAEVDLLTLQKRAGSVARDQTSLRRYFKIKKK